MQALLWFSGCIFITGQQQMRRDCFFGVLVIGNPSYINGILYRNYKHSLWSIRVYFMSMISE